MQRCSYQLLTRACGELPKACNSPIGAVQSLGTFKSHPLSPIQNVQLWYVLAVNPIFDLLLTPILAATKREMGVSDYHVTYMSRDKTELDLN